MLDPARLATFCCVGLVSLLVSVNEQQVEVKELLFILFRKFARTQTEAFYKYIFSTKSNVNVLPSPVSFTCSPCGLHFTLHFKLFSNVLCVL